MTSVMQTVSKSKLKIQLLEYLRQVEQKKQPLVITHLGQPVLKISPFKEDPEQTLTSLRGSVVFYKDPTEPVGEDDWEALK